MAINLGMNLNISQQQKLSMTTQLQQSIHMLQLTTPELVTLIENELKENPTLDLEKENKEIQEKSDEKSEIEKKDESLDNEFGASEYEENDSILEKETETNWEDYFDSTELWSRTTVNSSEVSEEKNYENFVSKEITLQEHLLLQLKIETFSINDYKIGEFIIGNINSSGYLKISVDEIMKYLNNSREDIEEIIQLIQTFDPVGVGARNLSESLFAQYVNSDDYKAGDIIERVIVKHLDLLSEKEFHKIARIENSSAEEIQDVMDYIAEFLNPRPGLKYASTDDLYIKPDVIVEKIKGKYQITLTDSDIPRLAINNQYKKILLDKTEKTTDTKNTKSYIKERLNSAKWFIDSIMQRRETILKVATSIVKFQEEFFDHGISRFKPLKLKDVALDVEIHESTASRVTTNKYMQTPRGVFEFKYFFSSSLTSSNSSGEVSSIMVKNKIKTLVDNENPKKPLSDQKIVNSLKEDGIEIARRTITKYREEMNILSSTKRKRL